MRARASSLALLDQPQKRHDDRPGAGTLPLVARGFARPGRYKRFSGFVKIGTFSPS